ncbi:MAG: FtsQ-type POTRA domain-containing protein [Spirochaetaceae bacterium]|jgi:cell division septal protein FtsQ|nr:FtsQ-type POTRA domain-containing protein [Spirochaetaceae bacterium]
MTAAARTRPAPRQSPRGRAGYAGAPNAEAGIDTEKEDGFRFEKPLKKLLIVLGILLLAEFAWLFVVSPCMPLSSVVVTGAGDVEKARILEAAGITARTSYISVNERQLEENLLALVWVAQAKAAKHFPDSLEIILYPREALAASLVLQDGAIVPALFDVHGVVFQTGKSAAALAETLPLVSGLLDDESRAGARIPAVYTPFLEKLAGLQKNADGLLDSISEIYVNKKAYNTFDLLLYPAYNQTRIRMASLDEDKLRYMFLLLDVFAEKRLDVEEIDFRTGTAAYKIRQQEGSVDGR